MFKFVKEVNQIITKKDNLERGMCSIISIICYLYAICNVYVYISNITGDVYKTKELTPFLDCVDQSPVVRSVLPKLLLQYRCCNTDNSYIHFNTPGICDLLCMSLNMQYIVSCYVQSCLESFGHSY